jgi:biopolymer transport protein ExbB/TolQ
MVTWLVLGAFALGLVLLVLMVLPVLGRLAALARAGARTRRQLAEAQTLQMSLAHLQERLASVQEHATTVQEETAARRNSAHQA